MSGLSELDLYNLSTTFSLVDAAILIAGGNPTETEFDEESCSEVKKTHGHEAYTRTFEALRHAALKGELEVDFSFSVPYRIGDPLLDEGDPHDPFVRADLFVQAGAKVANALVYRGELPSEESKAGLHICRVPNWHKSTVQRDVLKDWLRSCSVFPEALFPEGHEDEILNQSGPRYAPKLACAVAAWRAVQAAAPSRTVKQTLEAWVISNGARFGLGDDGVVSKKVAAEVATLANWNRTGGAPATPGSLPTKNETTSR